MNKLGTTLELSGVNKRVSEEKGVESKKRCVEERKSWMDCGLGDKWSEYQPVVQPELDSSLVGFNLEMY